MPTRLFNRTYETKKRRALRTNFSKAEILIWYRIRDRQLAGYKFRRQYGVGSYVVDFYCSETKLVIEIDGDSHFQGNAPEYDTMRQKFLEGLGMKVIRFTNTEVLRNLDEVLLAIRDYLTSSSRMTYWASPLLQKEREKRQRRGEVFLPGWRNWYTHRT